MQLVVAQGCSAPLFCQTCCKKQNKLYFKPGTAGRLVRRTSLSSFTVASQYEERGKYPSSSPRSYNNAPPRNLSSSIQTVSFNQQLLVVLAVPLAALGIPFIFGHPLVCIVLPLIVYCTPGLRAIAAPVCTALLQLILSGLRPSGSPRSEAFPWQQANTGAWSSPPIDVDYRALPGDAQEDAYTQTDTASRSSRQQHWHQESESKEANARPVSWPTRQQLNIRQSQRVPAASRQRRKINIRPAAQNRPNDASVVRRERPGQVGVNLRPSYTVEPRSNVVRALLTVFPFLRDWGGFL